jgi:hypothetical protein
MRLWQATRPGFSEPFPANSYPPAARGAAGSLSAGSGPLAARIGLHFFYPVCIPLDMKTL